LIENTNKKKAAKKVVNNINYDPVRIRELVFILNDERAENYNQWLELGWALHNIDPNSQELLDIWIDFSKKSSKFKEGECENFWEKSKNEGLTIACIHYWAKIDNKKKYDEFKDKDISKLIDASIKTQSNYDIAYVLFKMYEYDFIYCDNDWYIYKNHIWHRENDGMSLRQKISNELCKNYAKLMSYYNQVASGQILINNQELTEEEKEEYRKKNGFILMIMTKVKTTAFKENIMKECKELFSNKDFVKKLDSNHYLLGFSNGIYDLKKGELRGPDPSLTKYKLPSYRETTTNDLVSNYGPNSSGSMRVRSKAIIAESQRGEQDTYYTGGALDSTQGNKPDVQAIYFTESKNQNYENDNTHAVNAVNVRPVVTNINSYTNYESERASTTTEFRSSGINNTNMTSYHIDRNSIANPTIKEQRPQQQTGEVYLCLSIYRDMRPRCFPGKL
jgi:hypothetical protein